MKENADKYVRALKSCKCREASQTFRVVIPGMHSSTVKEGFIVLGQI